VRPFDNGLEVNSVHNELVFKASLKKAALILAGSILFIVMGVALTAEKPLLGWLCVAFFSLGIPAALMAMRPNATYLKLTDEGFEMAAMSRTTAYKWSDVERFQVIRVRGAKMIGIVFSAEYNRQMAARAVSSKLTGVEGAIPDNYNASVQEICRALNEWKSRR
jgi:hypothetical protein